MSNIISTSTHNEYISALRFKKLIKLLPPAMIITFAFTLFAVQPALSEKNYIDTLPSTEEITPSLLSQLDLIQESAVVYSSTESGTQKSNDEVDLNFIPPNIDSGENSSVNKVETSISINISSQASTEQDGEEITSDSAISVNGEEIELPENGRIRETIENENGTTKIRANIDSDGSSNFKISTDMNYDGPEGGAY